MTLQDLKDLFPSEALEIVVDNARQFPPGTMIRLRLIADSSTVYIDPSDGSLAGPTGITLNNIEGHFATEHFADLWRQIQNTNYYAQVTPIDKDRLTVFVLYAVSEKTSLGDLELAVTDRQTSDKSEKPLRSPESVKRHILNDYVLNIESSEYIVVARHPYSKDDSFQITDGKNVYSVKERSRRELGVLEPVVINDDDQANTINDPSDMVWAINSSERPFTNPSDFVIELWECHLKLADETTAEKQRIATKAFIESGLDRYLDAWKQYTEKEFELVQSIQSRAGVLTYREATFLTGKRYQLTIENSQMLADFLSCLDSLGSDSRIEIDATFMNKYGKKVEGTKAATLRAESGNSIVEVEISDGVPMFSGSIRVSIAMAKTQYDRRMAALNRILSQNSAKKDLAMLIGGEKASVSGLMPKAAKEAPLSELVLRCFGSHTPTDTQRSAISIALNTPDFAIIQGPPGTGKTTVINGIMQALTEKEKDPQLSYGKNLLTAYQRDATSHLAEKLRIYGLPAPVYLGERSNNSSSDSDLSVKDTSMDSWILEKRAELQKRNPDIANLEASDRLTDKLHLLKSHFNPETSSLGQTKSVLETLLAAISECEQSEEEHYKQRIALIRERSIDDLLSSEGTLSLRAPIHFSAQTATGTALLDEAIRRTDVTQHRLDRYFARRLATTEAAISDNGKESSLRILRRFQGKKYSEEITKVAEALSSLYDAEPISFTKIQSRKDILLYLLTDTEWNSTDQEFNNKVASLIDGLLEYVEKSNGTDEQRVLADYHNAFDVDNDSILREWLSDFMTAIAATHQRAVSKPVKAHKGIEKLAGQTEEPDVEFSNVLIDEAARSCPPDLLIPLACAQDRMILVGDQNQLPQFISDEVYEQIDGYSKAELDALVKKTMFERLIDQVKKLEQRDHIPRFIRLREQYRMPQTLGDIISQFFYNGELLSPLGNNKDHTPDLAYIEGKHLIWLDVIGGRQSLTDEHSLVRQSEVYAIVRMLKAIIQRSPNAQNYSFAIITFYSAQRNRIFQAIRDDDFLSRWNRTHKKIMVGTVDAFQGMEADIVFLSLVRSLPKYDRGRNLYGFLANSNRQCVALSRAKRCLIIAGDKSMVSGARAEAAKQAMPAIEKIFQLCRKEGIDDACILKDGEFTGLSL